MTQQTSSQSSHKPVFLASKSPRRAELLTQIGVIFKTLSVDVPEVRASGELPGDYVKRLAIEKASAGALKASGSCVIGADTIVECDGKVLEKPQNAAHASEMLALLSNNTHLVHTAVCLARCDGVDQLLQRRDVLVTSKVTFRAISPEEAALYWRTGEPADKAGGYAIQGYGGVFVSHLAGSYSGVMGLPIAETQKMLSDFGVPVWQSVSG